MAAKVVYLAPSDESWLRMSSTLSLVQAPKTRVAWSETRLARVSASRRRRSLTRPSVTWPVKRSPGASVVKSRTAASIARWTVPEVAAADHAPRPRLRGDGAGLGKQPMLSARSSSGAKPRQAVRSASVSAATRWVSTPPRNFKVRWNCSRLVQRTASFGSARRSSGLGFLDLGLNVVRNGNGNKETEELGCRGFSHSRQGFAPGGNQQGVPFLPGQFQVHGFDGLADALGVGRADDGLDARRVLEQPGQRDGESGWRRETSLCFQRRAGRLAGDSFAVRARPVPRAVADQAPPPGDSRPWE